MRSLLEHRSALDRCIGVISDRADSMEEHVTGTVRKRFDEVLGERVEEDRILAEIGSLLIRFGIDEELSRLRGHLEAFDEGMRSDRPIAKKLDFICQELNREINTIGSKSPLYEINRSVVEAKEAIEKMREQLRNVE